MLACSDSHTCASGAFNVAARGLGAAEIMRIACTGRTWHQVPRTIRYDLTGELATAVTGKDLFLHIAGAYGDATNHALEFGGPGLARLDMGDRRTVATQGAEVGADFTLFPADERCLAYLARRGAATPRPVDPDHDAAYAARRTVDLSAVEPMVARPGAVIGNTLPVGDAGDVHVDQCFIGSCANGKLEDLEIAARTLAGRTVAPLR